MNELALKLNLSENKGKLALIDIGSNSIRLVIHHQNGKYPFPLFNERINCRLGEGLSLNGKISSQSMSRAFSALQRFAFIIKTMSVKTQIIVATAAARNASNSKEFILPAEKILSHKIRILSSKEEARYASLGVVSNMKINNGLVADLGGGSLELVLIKNGKNINSTSLNIGHLSNCTEGDIKNNLKKVKWLSNAKDTTLYGTGGSFRALGSAYIKKYNYPLTLLHGLTFKKEKAIILLDNISESKENFLGIPSSRTGTISKAAEIMINLILHSEIKDVMISGTSIRDGLITELNSEKRVNPDKFAYYKVLAKNQRFNGMQSKIKKIFKPIFKKIANQDLERIFKISTNLSDISWDEQPDLRGYIAANKILSLPLRDFTHLERIWIAKVIDHRYVGLKDKQAIENSIINLLSEDLKKTSYSIGLGLRFIYIFSAGFPKNLDYIKFKIKKNTLICKINAFGRVLMDKENERRLKNFANACNLNYEII